MLSGHKWPETMHPIDPWFYPIAARMAHAMTTADMSSATVLAATMSGTLTSQLLPQAGPRPA